MATILCVDDEASSVLLMEDGLQQAGHTTVGVHNARAAMNVLALEVYYRYCTPPPTIR